MKNYKALSLLVVLFLTTNIKAQVISNGDFEDWSWLSGILLSEDSVLSPDYWSTYDPIDDGLYLYGVYDLSQDSNPHSGDFAMRVDPTLVLGDMSTGDAYKTFIVNATPDTLKFYSKWQKDGSGVVGVSISFYQQDVFGEFLTYISSQSWVPTSDISDWTEVIMDLDPISADVTHAIIRVYSSAGGFMVGNAWISVDDMSLETSVGIDELSIDPLRIVSNTCNNTLILDYDESISRDILTVFDELGKVVFSQKISRTIDTSQLSQGLYFIKLSSGKEISNNKFIVKR